MIDQQYAIATGKVAASPAEAIALAARWMRWDWFRIGLIAVGCIASVRALTATSSAVAAGLPATQ